MARNRPIQDSPPSASSSGEEEEESSSTEEEESSESPDDDAIQTNEGGKGRKPKSDSDLKKNSAVHTESTQPPSRDSAVETYSPKTKPKAQKEKDEVAGGNGEKSPKMVALTGSAFTRLWDDDDEILILNAMIQYRTNKGIVHVKASTDQLYNKIKKFKQKYYIDLEKNKSGRAKSFKKHHDLKCVKLANEIWVAGEIESVESKKGGKGGASGSGGGGGITVTVAKHLHGQKKESSVKKPKQILYEGGNGEGNEGNLKKKKQSIEIADEEGKEENTKQKKRLVNEEVHGKGKDLKKQKLGSIEVANGEQKEVITEKQKEVANEEGKIEGKELTAKKYPYLFSSLETGNLPKGARAIVMLGKVGEERLIELEKECRILMEAKWELAVKDNDLASKLLKLGQDALKSKN